MEEEVQRLGVLGIVQPSYYTPLLEHLKTLRKVFFMKKLRSTMIKGKGCVKMYISRYISLVDDITKFHRPPGLIDFYFLPLLKDLFVFVQDQTVWILLWPFFLTFWKATAWPFFCELVYSVSLWMSCFSSQEDTSQIVLGHIVKILI